MSPMHRNADSEETAAGSPPIRQRLAAGLLVFNAIAVPVGLLVLWQLDTFARSGSQMLLGAMLVAGLSLGLLGFVVPRSE